jgi:steroid 5-alpha reductase family enzyme
MINHDAYLLLQGWIAAALLMLALWLLQIRNRNAGIVDVGWAWATACLAVYFCFTSQSGVDARHNLIALLMALWGIRLGYYLARRVIGKAEDGRYAYMREYLGQRAEPVFFIFFQLQATWVVLFALPAWAAMQAPRPFVDWLDIIGVLIWLLALTGEAIADQQLQNFRANRENRGKVCNIGLWRYSRHPNYFFEWIHWFAYLCIGYGSPFWWINVLALPVILFFLLRLTGIPYTEQQAIRTRGEAYLSYRRRTSVFLPLPPRDTGNTQK